ncbi:MAG: hemagglutinin repeat-containing protein [Veillonella sp.]|nr:hemagglutinin repeat-containing protein [Veillonella sp.]
MKKRRLSKQIAAWLTLSSFVLQMPMATVMAAEYPIVPDANANVNTRPLVMETANGIPLVNVTAPTAGGVSVNNYTNFNVPTSGAILNNSYTLSNTQLAGMVQGNSHMARGSAQVILNQVTSTNPTHMNGFLEVAGHKASVVVANPNGITVNGGGFINTNQAILTTGQAKLGSNGLQSIDVAGGKVAVAGDGLNAKGADSLSILTGAAEVNAGIWGKDVAVVTGHNTIDTKALAQGNVSGAVRPSDAVKADNQATGTDTANGKQGVALDIAAIGGMYANSITLVGTDKGLGVNVDGVVAATKAINLDSAGNLIVNDKASIYSNRDQSIHADNVSLTSEKATLGADANLSIKVDGKVDSVGLINSGQVTSIEANAVDNHEAGRIYGDTVSVSASEVINHTNTDLEAKLDREMAKMQAAREALDQAWAIDITQFTNKAQEEAYYANIDAKTKEYDAQQAVVDKVVAELNQHKAGTIAGRNQTNIKADTITNRNHGYIYSDGDMNLSAKESIINASATIEAEGSATISAPEIRNENTIYSSKRVKDKEIENPDRIRIDQEGHAEQGKTFDKNEFSSLGSGYGAFHNRVSYAYQEELPMGEYAVVRALTPEEVAEGYETPDESLIGQRLPNYDYDDPIFKNLGIQSMSEERPPEPGPKRDAWDKDFQKVLDALNEKLPAYNAKVRAENEAHKAELAAASGQEIHNYTIVKTKTHPSHKEVTASDAGKILAGQNLTLEGHTRNTDSRIVADNELTTGDLTNNSDQQLVRNDVFGTTQQSYTYRRHWPHKSRRRGYRSVVYKTPMYNNEAPTTMGVETVADKTNQADKASDLTADARQRMADALNPFGVKSGTATPKTLGTIEGLTLPTASMYSVNPDITARYVVETDPAFTNKKNFISSDYFFDQLSWDPDHRMKRLGDGYYEQTLLNNQVLNQTGKRFLDGYTNKEEEYKALLDAGLRYAKEFNLAPGIALSKEQMEALTTDMVWMESATIMVDGKPVEVLYPKLYLANPKGIQLTADGNLISAKTIHVVGDSFENTGTVLAQEKLDVDSKDIHNQGTLQAKDMTLRASHDIESSGSITGETSVQLQAGHDIRLESQVDHKQNQDVLGSVANVSVSGDGGRVAVQAGHDVDLRGAILSAKGQGGNITIEAGNDLTVSTQALHSKADMTENADNYIRTERAAELGTDITATGNVNLIAGQDMTIRQGYVSSEAGNIKAVAGRDVMVENGDTYSKDDYALKYKVSGLVSKSKTTIRSSTEEKGVEGSTLSGDTVSILAGRDAKVQASNIVGTGDVTLAAANNVTVTSADTSRSHDYFEQTKKSGLMSAGMGFMIGSKSTKDTLDGEYVEQAKSNIGSEQGSVSIQAGDSVHITSSDVVADKGITVTGQDVTLDAKANTSHEVQTHEEKSSGLTVSLGGLVGNTMNTVSQQVSKAKHRQDKRLAALEMVEVGKTIKNDVYEPLMDGRVTKEITNKIAENTFTGNRFKNYPAVNLSVQDSNQALTSERDKKKDSHEQFKQNLVKINVSLGSQKSKQVYESNSVDYVGGTLATNGDVRIEAKSPEETKGSIKAMAETITGKNIDLSASKDISLNAAENTYDSRSNSKSSGWSLGTSIGLTGGSMGLDMSINQAKENSTTHQTNHRGTEISASESLHMASGQDTHIIGSNVSGQAVDMMVGRNLTVESLQDVNNYHQSSSSKGLNISYSPVVASKKWSDNFIGGLSYNQGKMDSSYASVTEQAGIYAGDKGFRIQTKDTTSLTGAVIDSTVDNEQADALNSLTTGKLVVKDIENKAEYKTKSQGMAYNKFSKVDEKGSKYNEKGFIPVLMPGSSDEASSITKSAIGAGKVQVTNQDFDFATLNRDTQNNLNKLDQIFDKTKIEERQELAKLVAKDAFNQLHYWQPKTKEDKWAKDLAHGIVGELAARIAGNSPGSGFTAAMTNEALVDNIKKVAKNNPDVAQWLSAIVGGMVNQQTSKSSDSGSAIAQNGMKWNGKWVPDIDFGSNTSSESSGWRWGDAQLDLSYSSVEERAGDLLETVGQSDSYISSWNPPSVNENPSHYFKTNINDTFAIKVNETNVVDETGFDSSNLLYTNRSAEYVPLALEADWSTSFMGNLMSKSEVKLFPVEVKVEGNFDNGVSAMGEAGIYLAKASSEFAPINLGYSKLLISGELGYGVGGRAGIHANEKGVDGKIGLFLGTGGSVKVKLEQNENLTPEEEKRQRENDDFIMQHF